MITAKDFVPDGASFQAIGGEILVPSQVYLAGSVPLFMKAVLSVVNELVRTIFSVISFLQENKILRHNSGIILNVVIMIFEMKSWGDYILG
jgi:hypothetical protein